MHLVRLVLDLRLLVDVAAHDLESHCAAADQPTFRDIHS